MNFYPLGMICSKCGKNLTILNVLISAADIWKFECLCAYCGKGIEWTSISPEERSRLCHELDEEDSIKSGEAQRDRDFLHEFGIGGDDVSPT